MNKWQIICPVVALGIVAIVFAFSSGSSHYRYYIYAQTRMLGEELSRTTNSARLVQVGPDLQKRLSEFLSTASGVAEVRLGDEPFPIGDGTACSRLILSNATGGRVGIRLRQNSEPEKFQVLGYWTITEPGGPANRGQPVSSETNRMSAAAGPGG